MKIVWISLGFFFLLVSCGDVGKALRNEKIKNTDEFLVKKKGPLVLPPDYERIPAPDTIVRDNDNEKNKIKKILKAPTQQKKIDNNSTSIEKSILEKIRK